MAIPWDGHTPRGGFIHNFTENSVGTDSGIVVLLECTLDCLDGQDQSCVNISGLAVIKNVTGLRCQLLGVCQAGTRFCRCLGSLGLCLSRHGQAGTRFCRRLGCSGVALGHDAAHHLGRTASLCASVSNRAALACASRVTASCSLVFAQPWAA